MPKRYHVKPPPLESARAHISLGANFYPQNPYLLQAALWAVLRRIAYKDPQETRELEVLLKELAALEAEGRSWDAETHRLFLTMLGGQGEPQLDLSTPAALVKTCHDLSYVIALGMITGKSSPHSLRNIQRQRDLLGAYLKQHAFESIKGNPARRLWVRDHFKTLLDLVSAFPCQCISTTAADRREIAGKTMHEWLQGNGKKSPQSLTRRTLIQAVLGAYHTMPADTLRKMLERHAKTVKALTKNLAT